MNTEEMLRKIPLDKGSVVHIFEGGSSLHGTSIGLKSDTDLYGVYIPQQYQVMGIDREEHHVSSTGNQDSKNTSEDIDMSLYSLQRWASLAAKGNPTILSFLFTPSPIPFWKDHVLPFRDLFLSKSHTTAFIGFGDSQLKRMQGLKGHGQHGQRVDHELYPQLGYDPKAAAHMIRMMYEGIELMETGAISFPNPHADMLISIKRGLHTQQAVEKMYVQQLAQLREAQSKSCLPDKVDREKISRLIANCHMSFWTYGNGVPYEDLYSSSF